MTLALDPLIAEAKRRRRRRRLLVGALIVVVAGAAVGATLALRGPGGGPRFSDGFRGPRYVKPPVQRIGRGPFVLSGGFVGGGESGLYGDGDSGSSGTTLGCVERRHYSEAFGLENRSKTAVTLTTARGPNPAPRFIDLVAIQLRLSPRQQAPRSGSLGGVSLGLAYHGWSAAPTRPVTIPPGRGATVQSNFLMHNCRALAPGKRIEVSGALVLGYRTAGRLHHKTIPLPSERLVLVPGPTRRVCATVPGSTTFVAADTGCTAARRAALACHPMSHNSWGDCTVAGVYWDCGSTAGPGAQYLETCYLPHRKSHWFRVRWKPPVLSGRAIGGVRFGLPRKTVVTRLSELLGERAPDPPRAVCGPGFTEIAFQHLYVELRGGRLAGFRYIEHGWPGERDSADRNPPLVTSKGITLGSTLAQARAAYGRLTAVGTNRWQTPDGLVLYDDARRYPDPAGSRITEIKYGTCGDL
jgi:hypothetical protein